MKIAFNPSTVAALITPPNNKDITFDLRGRNIFARGVKFCGTDTWRDIKINNVSIDSNILDLRNGSNTTLTNTNGVVTINSTWRPVVDNLTSDSTTSSLSAKQGKVLKSLIDGKSNSGHNHDDRYLKLTGGTLTGNLIGTAAMFSGRFYGNGDDEGIIVKPSSNGYAGLILGAHNGERSVFYFTKGNPFWRYNNGSTNLDILHPKKSGTIALTSDIPSSLKNPYSLTTFGVVYDGSAAKVVDPSNFISLVNEAASIVTDGTMFITSWASNNGFADTNAVNVPYKRKAIHLWEYIKAKTDSLYTTKSHNHDDRYLKLTGGIMTGTIYRNSGGSTISGRDHAIIRLTYAPGGSSWNPIACVDTETGTWTLGHLSSGDSDTNFHFCFSTNTDYNAGNNNGNYVTLRNKVGTIALLSEIPDKNSWNYDDRYLKLTGGTMNGNARIGYGSGNLYIGNSGNDGWVAVQDICSQDSIGDGKWSIRVDGTASFQSIKFPSNRLITQVSSGSNSPLKGIKLPNLQSNGIGIFSRVGNGSDEGGIVLSEDTCVIYNSFDTGWGLSVRDKDINLTDISGDNTIAFGIRQDYKAYSLGGFEKSGSNNSYVLLGGGGHKLESSLNVANADKVDGYHASSLVKFYLSPMTNDAPADSAKSWFINTMPYASGAIVYNVPGLEKTIIAGKSSGEFGHMLQLNYNDTYLRILRYYKSSWKSTDWEKISAGYADSAGNADTIDGLHYNSFLRKDTNDSTPYQYTFTKTDDHAIKVGTIRGTAVGSQTGYYIHLYERVAIGSPNGWGSRPAPSYGLATYGGAWLATDTGSVGIGTTSPSSKLTVNGDISLFNIGSIRNLAIEGGIYWNPYVESTTDGSDAASITLVKSGIAGGTTLVLSLMNDANDTILFKTNGSARLYHNSYPILTTLNTYVSNNKGYINGTEITLVNNTDNARKLVNWYSTRPTSLNTQFGDGSLRIFYATSSTTEGKPAEDSPILHLAWDNNGGWDTQLAVHTHSGKVSTRAQNSGTWQPWKTLAFTTDIPSSLKNPYALTISLNGTSQGPYDGSAAKNINITPGSIGAATSNHTHPHLPLSGGTVTGNIILKGETSADMTYAGNVHPYIRFDNSDSSLNVSLIFTDYDTYRRPAGIKLVGNQGNEWFEATNIYATTFYGALSGNASTATKLTSSAGNETLPIYFSDGRPIACTASSIFSNLSSSLTTNLSVTIAGLNRTITNLYTRYLCFTGRPTSMNVCYGDGTLRYFLATSTTTTGKPEDDSHILHFSWDHDGGWDSQLSIPTTTTKHVQWRTISGKDSNGNYIYNAWKTLANITDNVASATKLQTPRTIWGQSFNGTADVNGTIYINNNNSGEGAIRLNNNINSNARISAINDQVIFNTGAAIRFGGTSWDWNVWAGLKYTHSNKTIYLGIADGSVFNANSALSGGSLRFPGISNVYATTFNGSLSGNASTATNADKIDGVHLNGIFTAFGNNAHNITATIGGVTKSFLVNWAADSDKLDGYHENSFLRYRGDTSTDLEATLWSLIGIKLYNNALPDNLTGVYNYGSVISLPGSSSRFEIYASHLSSNGNGLYYRSGWGSDKKTWLKFIDSSNIGSQSVNYANSAGNADKLDGIHANGLLTALSNSNNGISITVGGTTKSVSNISVNYASSAGSATKVIVNLHTTNDTNYPLVWSNLSNSSTITENQLYKSWSDLYYNPKNKRLTVGGSVVASSFVKRGGTSLQLLRADGGIAAFNWSGQSGLPTWLWGGNNEHSYYVYNPSNFRVAYATSAGSADTALYLRSLGNLNCQTGRTLNYGDVYTYNTYANNTGAPTSYTSVIGFGRGIAGTVEIAGGWDNTNLYWRSLRDCCEDWHSWRTVLDSSNYTEFINNYYWANVKISTSSSTTTSPTVSNLTATSSIRMGNIYLLNTNEINSTSGIHLNYQNSGNISLCAGGGNVGIGTISPSYKLDVNGLMRASGFHHSSMNSDNYMLLAGGGYKSFGGDSSHPVFLGYLNLDHGSDGTVSSSFYCLGYSVPFTYTRGGNYCKISIPDTTHQAFYIKAATASVNYSGGGMDTWTGNHRGAGAWWLHCYAPSSNEVRVKGFHLKDTNNDSWWGGNPLWSDRSGVNRITVCIFGYVTFR